MGMTFHTSSNGHLNIHLLPVYPPFKKWGTAGEDERMILDDEGKERDPILPGSNALVV